MKKILVVLLFGFLPNIAFAESSVDLYEHLRAASKVEHRFNVTTEDLFGDGSDIFIRDANTLIDDFSLFLKPAGGKSDVFVLFKLECVEKNCLVEGYIDFHHYDPRFVLLNYDTETAPDVESLTEAYNEIFVPTVKITGFAKWQNDAGLFWIVDDPNRMMPDLSLAVFTTKLSKEQKVALVKECWNKCSEVTVTGKIRHTIGEIALDAEKVSKAN